MTSQQVDHPARAERVAIVTGAGGGLGSAVARLLAETRDYRLCLVDNRRDAVETVADEVRATRRRHRCIGRRPRVGRGGRVGRPGGDRPLRTGRRPGQRGGHPAPTGLRCGHAEGLRRCLPHQHARAVPPGSGGDARHGQPGLGPDRQCHVDGRVRGRVHDDLGVVRGIQGRGGRADQDARASRCRRTESWSTPSARAGCAPACC